MMLRFAMFVNIYFYINICFISNFPSVINLAKVNQLVLLFGQKILVSKNTKSWSQSYNHYSILSIWWLGWFGIHSFIEVCILKYNLILWPRFNFTKFLLELSLVCYRVLASFQAVLKKEKIKLNNILINLHVCKTSKVFSNY